jgi:hypothetical protein
LNAAGHHLINGGEFHPVAVYRILSLSASHVTLPSGMVLVVAGWVKTELAVQRYWVICPEHCGFFAVRFRAIAGIVGPYYPKA